jgi:hypothetical protein
LNFGLLKWQCFLHVLCEYAITLAFDIAEQVPVVQKNKIAAWRKVQAVYVV